jgi:DNA-binding NarL/FixJ family response regulator
MTSLRVLVAEDEPLIAMMMEDFLDLLGHQVVGPVETASEGVKLAGAGGIDIAICDVNLRDGPSWPVLDAIKAEGTPYIIATGGHVEAPPAAHADAPQLAKPYTLDGLRDALHKVMGA